MLSLIANQAKSIIVLGLLQLQELLDPKVDCKANRLDCSRTM